MAKEIQRVKARGKTRYRVRVYMGIDPGTGRQVWTGGTYDLKKDAEKARDDARNRKGKGIRIAPGKQSLREYLEGWLPFREKRGVRRGRRKGEPLSPGTLHDERRLIKRFIFEPPEDSPPLGQIPLSRLQPEDFERFYDHFWEIGTGRVTLRYLHKVLKLALKDAVVVDRIFSYSPAESPRATPSMLPREGEEPRGKIMRAMTEEQAKAFMEAAKEDRLHALWVLLLTRGLRPSEALGLLWEDVDLEEGKIHIRRTLSRRGIKRDPKKGIPGWRLKETKTESSQRVIALPGITLQAFKTHKAIQAEERLLLGAEWQDHGFAFTTQTGQPLDSTNLLTQNFRRVCREAGLGTSGTRPPKPKRGIQGNAPFRAGFRMYDLRHTCATLLRTKGVPVEVVAKLLGHSSTRITSDVYSHVVPKMQEMEVRVTDEIYPGEEVAA